MRHVCPHRSQPCLGNCLASAEGRGRAEVPAGTSVLCLPTCSVARRAPAPGPSTLEDTVSSGCCPFPMFHEKFSEVGPVAKTNLDGLFS